MVRDGRGDGSSPSEKKITPNQIQGAQGEAVFGVHAIDRGLLPTKVQTDVGIDFVCQVMAAQQGAGKSRGIEGQLVGTAVRSTSTPKSRIRLTRDDALSLLRSDFPAFVALVEMKTQTVYHRFVDAAFALQLRHFLQSNNKTLSLTPADCRAPAEFAGDLKAALSPGAVESRRLAIAEAGVAGITGGARLTIHRQAGGSYTVVRVLDSHNIFDTSSTAQQDKLRLAIYGTPTLRAERLSDIGPHPVLVEALEGLPPAVVVGLTEVADIELAAQNTNGRAVEPFIFEKSSDYWGWSHAGGFALTISAPREEVGLMVHHLDAVIDPDADLFLSEHEGLWSFLERCSEDGRLGPVGDDLRLSAGDFARLAHAHTFARCLRAFEDLPGWEQLALPLRAALTDETLHTLSVFESLIREPQLLKSMSFALDVDGSELQESARLRVPIVGNVLDQAVIAWLEAESELILVDGIVVGYRFGVPEEIELQVTTAVAGKGEYAELVGDETWPGIAITPTGPTSGSRPPGGWPIAVEVIG